MRQAAVEVVEVPAFELVDLVLLNAEGEGVGRACAGGPSFEAAAAHQIDVVVAAVVDHLLLGLPAQALLQLYLHYQVHRHYLFLRKLVAVAVLPVGERVSLFPLLLALLTAQLQPRNDAHSVHAFGSDLHFYLSQIEGQLMQRVLIGLRFQVMEVIIDKVGDTFVHFDLDFLEVGALEPTCFLVLLEEEYESIAVFPEADHVPPQGSEPLLREL